jgi:hypothetical protein
MTTPVENSPAATAEDSPGIADFAAVAGRSVGLRLGELLEPVFAGEPPIGDAVEAVFRRAERLRRRRSRAVLAVGAAVVVLVTAIGYALTTVLLPTDATRAHGTVTATAGRPDAVQAILAPVLRESALLIVPRDPARGDGWRRYVVHAADGRPYGLVEVSVYAAPGRLCFPVLAARNACARPVSATDHVQYVRYAFDRDVNWQVNEAIARRLPDGRTIAVQATGERGTGTAAGGRPPLSALLTARLAVDPHLMAAFGPRERCNGPNPACPVLEVPVPVAD